MMNEAVKHPERRAVEVGQRRRSGTGTFTIYAIEGPMAITCRAGMVDPGDGYVHRGNSDCCWESMVVLEDCELLIDAPAAAPIAADRTGCKAFCGWRYRDFETTNGERVPGAEKQYDAWLSCIGIQSNEQSPIVVWDRQVWCTDKCMRARHPPLAAQPAETKLCMFPVLDTFCNKPISHTGNHQWHIDRDQSTETLPLDAPCPGQCGGGARPDGGYCNACQEGADILNANASRLRKSATQSVPAKGVLSDIDRQVLSRCIGCSADANEGHRPGCIVVAALSKPAPAKAWPPVLIEAMNAHYKAEAQVAWMAAQTGTPYTGPERIERPRLAHVANLHDDDLIGGAR